MILEVGSTSGLTRNSGICPKRTSLVARAVRTSSSLTDSTDKKATCGVTITLSSSNNGLSALGSVSSKTSNPAPAIVQDFNA